MFGKVDDWALEKYILDMLKKNKHNTVLAYNQIFAKYPFFKQQALKDIILSVLEKKINNEKIGGEWVKIKGKWCLENVDKKKDIKSDHLNFMGPELPASQEETTSFGPKGKYNTTFMTAPDDMDKKPDTTLEEAQDIYNKTFEECKIKYDGDIETLNQIIFDELGKNGFKEQLMLIKKKTI